MEDGNNIDGHDKQKITSMLLYRPCYLLALWQSMVLLTENHFEMLWSQLPIKSPPNMNFDRGSIPSRKTKQIWYDMLSCILKWYPMHCYGSYDVSMEWWRQRVMLEFHKLSLDQDKIHQFPTKWLIKASNTRFHQLLIQKIVYKPYITGLNKCQQILDCNY